MTFLSYLTNIEVLLDDVVSYLTNIEVLLDAVVSYLTNIKVLLDDVVSPLCHKLSTHRGIKKKNFVNIEEHAYPVEVNIDSI